jgi:hypothetical protein
MMMRYRGQDRRFEVGDPDRMAAPGAVRIHASSRILLLNVQQFAIERSLVCFAPDDGTVMLAGLKAIQRRRRGSDRCPRLVSSACACTFESY